MIQSSLFPGEDGMPMPAEHPQLTPDTLVAIAAACPDDTRPPDARPWALPTDAKARKRLQMWTYLMEYFPDALLAELEVSILGNEQHNAGQPLHWSREKSTDQMNTAFRHMWDRGRGVYKDTDGAYHLAKAIWRLKAQLQLDIEQDTYGVK